MWQNCNWNHKFFCNPGGLDDDETSVKGTCFLGILKRYNWINILEWISVQYYILHHVGVLRLEKEDNCVRNSPASISH